MKAFYSILLALCLVNAAFALPAANVQERAEDVDINIAGGYGSGVGAYGSGNGSGNGGHHEESYVVIYFLATMTYTVEQFNKTLQTDYLSELSDALDLGSANPYIVWTGSSSDAESIDLSEIECLFEGSSESDCLSSSLSARGADKAAAWTAIKFASNEDQSKIDAIYANLGNPDWVSAHLPGVASISNLSEVTVQGESSFAPSIIPNFAMMATLLAVVLAMF